MEKRFVYKICPFIHLKWINRGIQGALEKSFKSKNS